MCPSVIAPGQPLLVVPQAENKSINALATVTKANAFNLDFGLFMFISFKKLTVVFKYHCQHYYAKVIEKVQRKQMKVHFIAIGGSVMHNLALALHEKGIIVTGSDDEIFEPALGRLSKAGILPPQIGWFENRITTDIHAVVLGMHARADNPELLRAKSLAIPVYSFPEYIYQQSINKKRVVIAGSHGKTSTTAMIMHVLKYWKMDFDYMVGAQLEGFDLMVRLSDAPVIILEGDEYPDGAINRTPKFLFYKADIGLITGIAWDHVNIFPTYEEYVQQFGKFIESVQPNGKLIYNIEDNDLVKEVEKHSVTKISYQTFNHRIENGVSIIQVDEKDFPLQIFGKHNLQNMAGAMQVCIQLGLTPFQFASAIQSFSGAAKRLEKIVSNNSVTVYRDFAHSPSKLTATIKAAAEQFEGRKIIAVFELHTYSSLSESFLNEYKNSMNEAAESIVFYNQHALQIKKLPPLNKKVVATAFNGKKLQVIDNRTELEKHLHELDYHNSVLLLMSSGNYDNMDLKTLSTYILNQTNQ